MEMEVVTLVTFDSETVKAEGMDRPPYAKAAKRAAFAFSSDTMAMARSGLSGSGSTNRF